VTADSHERRSALESALLEYHRSPGKYSLAMRQPEVVFASVHAVLQMAGGRAAGAETAAAPSHALQQAARFFVRCALLRPDADHYVLLGLDATAEPQAVKERYRLMMRLMHPDFAGAVAGFNWPADAATRVNQAYDVLSSPVRRRAYDEKCGVAAPSFIPASQPAPHSADLRRRASRPPSADPRKRLKGLALLFGTVGGFAALAMVYVSTRSEDESLVQRSREIDAMVASAMPTAIPAVRVATAEPPATAGAEALPPFPEPSPAPDPMPSAMLPVVSIAPGVAQTGEPPSRSLAPIAEVAQQPVRLPVVPAAIVEAPDARVAASALPIPAARPTAVPRAEPLTIEPAPPVVVAVAPPPPQTLPRAEPMPAKAVAVSAGVTLAEVHPLLSKLLQQMESGWGDQVLNVLERDARGAPAAQALARSYNAMLEGGHRVRLSHVQFKAEPREGRLLVTGHLMMVVGEQLPGTPPKPFAMQAEFVSRGGTVVMTGLAQVQEN
jgi:hypothetical protein